MAPLFLKIYLLALCWTQLAAAYAIKGVQAGVDPVSGARPFRLEISMMNGPAWDLYILALQKYSQTNQSDQFSNYRISGELTILFITVKVRIDSQRQKEYTATPNSHGMTRWETAQWPDTVPTARSCFPCGTDLI